VASKSLQRKKPGYTKGGDVKIVSLSAPQLVKLLENTSKPKIKSKIQNRLVKLKYVAPAAEEPVVDTPAEEVVQ
jgi:hypothetical protein